MALEPSTPAGSRQEYEFFLEQEGPIRDLAKWMALVGWCPIAIGVLACLPALAGNVISLIGGVLFLCLGAWTRNATMGFRQIVATQSQDISHLMAVIRKLLRMYQLQVVAIVIALVFQVLVASCALLSVSRP